MALDPLPQATGQADGSLLIPKVTFDYMRAALSDFEDALSKPEAAFDQESLRGLRKVIHGAKVQAGGNVVLSAAARKFLARCMHDLTAAFSVEGQRANQITLASLEKSLGPMNVGGVTDDKDELLARALAD